MLSPAAGPSGKGGGRKRQGTCCLYIAICGYVICMHVYVLMTNWSLVGCCSVAFHIIVVI